MLKQTITIFLMGLLSFLFGCNQNNKTKETNQYYPIKLKDITSRLDKSEGWRDIFLKITSKTKTDTSNIYIVKGLYKEKVVGLEIEISSEIGAGIINGELDPKLGFASEAVQIKSIGTESDEFVKALAELYEQPIPKGFTKNKISSTAFSLNDKPVALDKKDKYKLKVFFEEDDENLYSEIYLNINTNKGEIEIHEKDEEYREPIIKVFSK